MTTRSFMVPNKEPNSKQSNYSRGKLPHQKKCVYLLPDAIGRYPKPLTLIVPLTYIEYGCGYVILRSPYTPYSIYWRGTITLNSSFHFLFHYPNITPISLALADVIQLRRGAAGSRSARARALPKAAPPTVWGLGL